MGTVERGSKIQKVMSIFFLIKIRSKTPTVSQYSYIGLIIKVLLQVCVCVGGGGVGLLVSV